MMVVKRNSVGRGSIIGIFSFLLGACTFSSLPAPVEDRSIPLSSRPKTRQHVASTQQNKAKIYRVKPGDSLYQIALYHGISLKDLSDWNHLTSPNEIQTGQILRLSPQEDTKTVEVKPFIESGKTNPTLNNTKTDTPDEIKSNIIVESKLNGLKPNTETFSPSTDKQETDWIWPTKGTPSSHFSDSNKGIDIVGKEGQPIFSIAPGKVFYAGNSLPGYGNLIIIKHDKEFLSVYAHNKKLFVKEGDIVEKGEKIAEMGNSGANQVKLHLEIRKFGKPVDPSRYISVDTP